MEKKKSITQHIYTNSNEETIFHLFVTQFSAIIIGHFALLMGIFALTQEKESTSEFILGTTGILIYDKSWKVTVSKEWNQSE